MNETLRLTADMADIVAYFDKYDTNTEIPLIGRSALLDESYNLWFNPLNEGNGRVMVPWHSIGAIVFEPKKSEDANK